MKSQKKYSTSSIHCGKFTLIKCRKMLEENGTEDRFSRRPFVEDRTKERMGTFFSKVGVGGTRDGGGNIERDSSARACVRS